MLTTAPMAVSPRQWPSDDLRTWLSLMPMAVLPTFYRQPGIPVHTAR